MSKKIQASGSFLTNGGIMVTNPIVIIDYWFKNKIQQYDQEVKVDAGVFLQYFEEAVTIESSTDEEGVVTENEVSSLKNIGASIIKFPECESHTVVDFSCVEEKICLLFNGIVLS